jgi:hypothetical protein
MHTEEDTFNALTRTPVSEMRLLIRELRRDGYRSQFASEQLLKKHGWMTRDYNKEISRIIKIESVI